MQLKESECIRTYVVLPNSDQLKSKNIYMLSVKFSTPSGLIIPQVQCYKVNSNDAGKPLDECSIVIFDGGPFFVANALTVGSMQ